MQFIHIPKTAGKSVHAVFPRTPPFERHHQPMSYYKDETEFYTTIRNPYDRLVSLFCYINRDQPNYNEIHNPEYFYWWFTVGKDQEPKMANPNVFNTMSWYLDVPEKPVKILRFETVGQDFKELFGQDLPHVNENEHPPYQGYYDKKMTELVRDYYSEDFIRFNYSEELV